MSLLYISFDILLIGTAARQDIYRQRDFLGLVDRQCGPNEGSVGYQLFPIDRIPIITDEGVRKITAKGCGQLGLFQNYLGVLDLIDQRLLTPDLDRIRQKAKGSGLIPFCNTDICTSPNGDFSLRLPCYGKDQILRRAVRHHQRTGRIGSRQIEKDLIG